MDTIWISALKENVQRRLELQPSRDNEMNRSNVRQWRHRISSDQAARIRQQQREREQMRAQNMTSTEINARLERRRIAQRLRRSTLPPNHMGASNPPRSRNQNQERSNTMADRRIIDEDSQHNSANDGSPSTSQGFNGPTVGTSTITTLRWFASTNSIRIEGSSSNTSNYTPPIIGKGTLNPHYVCGPPIRVSQSQFPDSSGLPVNKTAFASWQVVCNITKPKGSSPKCCISFQHFTTSLLYHAKPAPDKSLV